VYQARFEKNTRASFVINFVNLVGVPSKFSGSCRHGVGVCCCFVVFPGSKKGKVMPCCTPWL